MYVCILIIIQFSLCNDHVLLLFIGHHLVFCLFATKQTNVMWRCLFFFSWLLSIKMSTVLAQILARDRNS